MSKGEEMVHLCSEIINLSLPPTMRSGSSDLQHESEKKEKKKKANFV